jgi:hypothetical protein
MTEAGEVKTYSERKLIRERLQREEIQGVSLDAATKCICHCGQVHYRKKEKVDEIQNLQQQENKDCASGREAR